MSRQQRVNEYFLPEESISREVIQADICRYLGNDALVRPGTHQGRHGYLIRAYRNLTTEMISDLKADSARWEAEASRRERAGYAPVSYMSSQIHEVRQQMGPTGTTQQQQQQHQQQLPGGYPDQPGYGHTSHPSYGMPQQQYQQHPQQQQGVPDSYDPYTYAQGGYVPTSSAPGYPGSTYAYDDGRQGQPRTYPEGYDDPRHDPRYGQPGYYPLQSQPAGMPTQQTYADPRADPRNYPSSGYPSTHGQSTTPTTAYSSRPSGGHREREPSRRQR